MSKRIILLALLALPVVLFAQYDEKQIMLQRAQGFEMRQQFAQANTVYEQLNEKYPGDSTIVSNWVRNLLRTSQDDEAAQVLADNRGKLPALTYSQLSVQVDLKRGRVDSARDVAWEYLRAHPQQQAFQEFANLFVGYQAPEEAISIFEEGRRVIGSDKIFTLELARAHQQARHYEQALDEYLVHLRDNHGYLNYVANQLRPMLDDDRRLMDRLARFAHDDDDSVRELVALGWVHLGEMDRAFEIYTTLAPLQLKRFADEQFALDNLSVALRAYRGYIERERDPYLTADAEVAVARVYGVMGEADSTRAVLLRLYNDPTLRSPRARQAARANQIVREMLANIAMSGGDFEQAETYLRESIDYTRNLSERTESQLRLAQLQMLLGQYEESDRYLATILDVESPDEKVAPSARYIRWFSLWLRGDAYADSVLNTMVVKDPGRPELNDALLLTLLTIEQGDAAGALREAMRLQGLHQTAAAVDALVASGSPQLTVLAGEWAFAAGLDDRARAVFDRDWENADHAALAQYRLAQMSDTATRAANFLNQQPSHPFSPLFRRLLQKQAQ